MILNDLSKKFEPSDKSAYERYEVIAPILTEATEQYMRLYNEFESEERNREIRSRLDDCFGKAARQHNLEKEEVCRCFQAFCSQGMPGLMSPIPFDARRVAKSFQGTWQLRARYTNGGKTPYCAPNHTTNARSSIYYESTGESDLTMMATMWVEENYYPREGDLQRCFGSGSSNNAFFLVSLLKVKLTQLDEYTVDYRDEGEVIGNYGDFEKGVRVKSRALMMRFGASESLLGVPEQSMITEDGQEIPAQGMFQLLNVTGCGPRTLSFVMSGLPPMFGDENRTHDTVDTYLKEGEDQPLIGGWETLEDYYRRLRDMHMSAADAKACGRSHGFYPRDCDVLRHYQRDKGFP